MYNLRSKGRFVSRKHYALHAIYSPLRELKNVRWVKAIALSYMIAVPFSIAVDAFQPQQYLKKTITVVNAQEIATSTPPMKVLIELSYTKERIEEKIMETFPDAPVMVRIAKCESGLVPKAYNPTNNSHDGGIFQISEKYHGDRLEALGLDRFDVEDSLKYARMLYDEAGLAPWSASKHCWSK